MSRSRPAPRVPAASLQLLSVSTTVPPAVAPWRENRPERAAGAPLAELWRARELVLFFALRDLRLRYKQAVLGALWVVIQPVLVVVAFTFVFDRVARVGTGGVPYPLFALVGFVGWSYFATVVGRSSEVLVANTSLVTKVWFPRMAAPVAALLPTGVDLAVGLGMVAVLCVWWGVVPGWAVLGLALWLVLLVLTTVGVALWLSALNVRYRDVRHAVAPVLQVALFASPVAYAGDVLDGTAALLYALNPMVGVIGVARWALLDQPWPGLPLLVSAAVTVALAASGYWYFSRSERSFADVI